MENLVIQTLFKGIYKGKKVLLTGHTGFKGSWLGYWLQQLGAEITGFSLSPNTDPAHFNFIGSFGNSVIGDINDGPAIRKLLSDINPDIVFHLAAQPLVRRSYADPLETFQTNIIGTVHLFEAIRQTKSVKAVVNITTDKVYRNHEGEAAFKESDVLGGHDPYSTSKACMELVHESYHKSFFKEAGIHSATARAGNVIGGGDWAAERLVPDLVRAAATGQIAAIRNPESIRPWQHVLDPLSGYLLLGQRLIERASRAEGAWNFGPDVKDCLRVSEVLNMFKKYWPAIQWQDRSVEKKLHESGILRLDCSKAHHELGWAPIWDIEQTIEKTASWYAAFYSGNRVQTREDLDQYISDATARAAVWAS